MNIKHNNSADNQKPNYSVPLHHEQSHSKKKINPQQSHIASASGTSNSFKPNPSALDYLKPESDRPEQYQNLACDVATEIRLPKEQIATEEVLNVSQAVVKMLEGMGVKHAFGVSGGAIAPMWHALQHSSIKVMHFRHEAGAAFAATEAYFASDEPVVVFTTTGPGITNALTGLYAARWEGAKVIFISAYTSAPQRGRWACQETSSQTMGHSGLFASGELFNYASTIECAEQLPETARRIDSGLSKPNGFVAHLSIPTSVQSDAEKRSIVPAKLSRSLPSASEKTIVECAELLSRNSFAIWVGFGARKAAAEIRELAERTGVAVMSSPRGKGIFPEDHTQYVGVTGFAGHQSVLQYMQEQRPDYTLVLGTRLGEPTSFWNPQMIPAKGFIHVDIDPEVPGTAYPEVDTLGIQSDIGEFVTALLKHVPQNQQQKSHRELPRPERTTINPDDISPVRPQVLMNLIQRIIVEGTNASIMAEAGGSFAWAINRLRFSSSGRFRVTTGFGSMGHFATGVIGASMAGQRKAVALVGDGSMLMNNEISTAVRYQVPAVWIVLNNGCYNMCKKGSMMQGYKDMDVTIPLVNFAEIACSMGAEGIRVETESDIQAALETAITSAKPFVLDVIIDSTQDAPIGTRIKSLCLQRTDK
ncbi:MAG: thiamine pyrophosphate-dependent enzyme [Cyanobacteria bacterium J06621_8]